MNYPTIDGHFWVVRDGQVVDWDFPSYALTRRLFRCKPSSRMHYREADPLVQQVMIEKFKRATQTIYGTKDWSECAKLVAQRHPEAEHGECWKNALCEVTKNGGEIKFGSMGFEKESGGIHWEYGGEAYTTVANFLKPSLCRW